MLTRSNTSNSVPPPSPPSGCSHCMASRRDVRASSEASTPQTLPHRRGQKHGQENRGHDAVDGKYVCLYLFVVIHVHDRFVLVLTLL